MHPFALRPGFRPPLFRSPLFLTAVLLVLCVSVTVLVLNKDLGRLLSFSKPRSPRTQVKTERKAAVTYRKVKKGGVPMHVIQIDLRSPSLRIGVATARKGIGHRDQWSAMIARTRPTAALTGTYFCTRSGVPVGSIVAGGQEVHSGYVGSAFSFATGQGARMAACRRGVPYRRAGADTMLRSGPRLLCGGKLALSPRAEGFTDRGVYRRARRTAVAITRRRKLLVVAVEKRVLLRELAGALKAMGAVDAMCMDGGTSAGLYYRGKTHVRPRRPLTNLLLVYDSAERYERQARSLHPAALPLLLTDAGQDPG